MIDDNQPKQTAPGAPAVELTRGGFRPSPSLRNDPLDPMATVDQPGGNGAEPPAPSGPPASASPSTKASHPSDDSGPTTPAALAQVLAGGLLILAAGLSLALRWSRRNLELRRPTQRELAEVTHPTARIVLRHTDVAMETRLLADIADGCRAAAGVVDYLETDPIRRRAAPEPAPPAPTPEG